MPAKKNYGTAHRSTRGIGRETRVGRQMPMRMSPPLSQTRSESSALPTPLRDHAERALTDYFANLDGHRPAHLYELVIREVEEPLFRAVLDHCDGNQSRAAGILGINRGTLRKKLREFGLSA